MIKMHALKSACWILGLVVLIPAVWAQNGEDINDEVPPSETEIICYAAKNQWVCAPADEKEKAHEKAMKLAEQPSQQPVEIQTMDVNNGIAQQVQEQPPELDPNSLEAAIQDFIPREDANQQVNNQPPEPVEEPVVAQPDPEPVTTVQATPEPTPPVIQSEPPQRVESTPVSNSTTGGNNDFLYWQRNYPNRWSFQVIGTSNRHKLDQFIIDQGLNNAPYAVVKTQVNNADWWVVLSGLFDSREEALSQRYTLPSGLADQAWVRQIQTIIGEAD